MNIQNSQKKAAWKTILLVILSAPAVLFAQTAEIPRLENGLPDMQGTWDFRTITPFQRPEALGNKSVLTAEEASIFEAEERERRDRDNFTDTTTTGDYNQFWYDRGEEILGDRRTSLVTSPANGRIPALTEVAQQRISERRAAARLAEGIEVRPLAERCIMGFNSGPPMIPSAYNNNLQIVQTDGYFMMHNEMIHNIRPVRLNDAVHMDVPRKWEGDSVGHWEGDTLVIETRNFARDTAFGNSSANMQLTEKFWMIDADTLNYEFTIEDPTTWTEPWTVMFPMVRAELPIYEYACHEGNYSMAGILGGWRTLESLGQEGQQD
ncbi:hypothetical protein OAL54_10385 [Gammaproteobacteria bacterium]|jgi:hypothetical protein|uniref:Uncharacterized protein n=1 Tax=OM182 bacterium MED-G28 TaxID=1986256 RepID=A0A2A5WCC6_9GAMM|nr:hypothetical protein [Gammaproteobacteria bacterium]MDC0222131.1 hypothetical protein [Gammaproteobacteria bacterium]PDH33973.1 MAG: hypothetical protein CNF02_06350 [OM182 bacterium MED-G28]|tara:strand:- start:156 stop:1121 length:966 start_codon:yes stop_codon:yes gene_type:complete